MSLQDFLFEGTTPPAVTSTGSTVQGMPTWMSQYAQQLIEGAAGAGAEPYQPYGGPRLAGLTPDQLKAYGMVREGAGEAPGMIRNAVNQPGALTAAQPYINAATQKYPDVASQYVNPYTENVIKRAGTLAGREFNEKFMPNMARTFGSAGADARSSEYRRAAEQGLRDREEGLHEQALGALSQAWESGADTFNKDATRSGQAAQLSGTFAGNQRAQDADLAGALQRANLADASALEATGQAQQADTQRSLDLARSDFEEQRDYPWQQLDRMADIGRGTKTDQTTTTSDTGPLPGSTYGPTGASQLGSLAATVGGLYNLFSKKPGVPTGVTPNARGGRIHIPHYGRGALRHAHAA